MRNTPWIVTGQNMAMECRRCGQSYAPATPIPVYLYVALSNAFLENHQDCVEAEVPAHV